MATPTTPTEDITTAGSPQNDPANPSHALAIGWFNAVVLIIGGIAAIGFIVALAGAYLIDNVPTILAGTIVTLVAAIAWIMVSIFWMGNVIKRRFTSRDRATIEARQSR